MNQRPRGRAAKASKLGRDELSFHTFYMVSLLKADRADARKGFPGGPDKFRADLQDYCLFLACLIELRKAPQRMAIFWMGLGFVFSLAFLTTAIRMTVR